MRTPVQQAIHGIIQAIDELAVQIQYDQLVAEVATEKHPKFYEQMSAHLLHLEEYLTLAADTHKSQLDQLTP